MGVMAFCVLFSVIGEIVDIGEGFILVAMDGNGQAGEQFLEEWRNGKGNVTTAKSSSK